MMSTVLTLHPGGRDPAQLPHRTEAAAEALRALAESMPSTDALRDGCLTLAMTLEARVLRGYFTTGAPRTLD